MTDLTLVHPKLTTRPPPSYLSTTTTKNLKNTEKGEKRRGKIKIIKPDISASKTDHTPLPPSFFFLGKISINEKKVKIKKTSKRHPKRHPKRH